MRSSESETPRLLFVAPDNSLREKVSEVIRENNWEGEVRVIHARDYVALGMVRLFRQKGITGVISRGGTHELIKYWNRDLPIVLDVGSDAAIILLQYLKLAEENSGKVAICCTDSLLPRRETVEEAIRKGLMPPPRIIRHPRAGEPELERDELLKELKDFQKNGGETVICDAFSSELSAEIGLRTVLVETLKEEVKSAISYALKTQRQVFVIMPFREKHDKDDLFVCAIKPAIESGGLVPFRIDQEDSGEHITPAIEKHIRQSALVVADISQERPNCYYELGYARGLGKRIIILIRKGETVHFDVFDLLRIEYDSLTHLRDLLTDKLKSVLSQ